MSHREPPPEINRLSEFRERFWQPPRAHGDVIEDRTVSFLELFYDLVYVVVIAQASHALAAHLTVRGVIEFLAVFGLIWIAWVNGTVYQDLHGRDDGRSRAFVFLQMLILATLAVFTADAAGDSGSAFAWVYTVFLILLTWLWYAVRRQDAEEYMAITRRYLIGMGLSVAVMALSAVVPDGARLTIWLVFVLAWSIGNLALGRSTESSLSSSDSMVERYGLFMIIVLGEVVVGVVTGMSDSDGSFLALATGVIGLTIGFAFWWTYFDFVGRRHPRPGGRALTEWSVAHFPVVLAIAASGAAMVSLVEHGADARAPASSAWLLSGSVAVALLSLVLVMRTLVDFERVADVYKPLTGAMFVSAAAALLVGWMRPPPWLLVFLLVMVMSASWVTAIFLAMSLDNPEDAFSPH